MNTLTKTATGAAKPEQKSLRNGGNFFNPGTFKDICSSCMNYKDIVYVFKMQDNKILQQSCESCFE